MKKKFLSAILFGALLVSSTGTFVSCKDYDDDISSLQAKDSELSTQLTTQLSALQSALDAAKADIAAAKAEAAAAKAEAVAAAKDLADEAKAEAAAAKAEAAAAKADAAAAKEAAATAKAEAIEAAKAQVEEMLKDVATAAQVKELEARVAAIEGLGLSAEQLGKLSEQLAAIEGLNLPAELEKLNELVKTVNELGTQLAAVEKYQELIKANADALDVFKKEVEGKYATSASVAEEIKKAIQGLASEEYVGKEISDKIAAALQGNGAIGQAISNALQGYATEEYVNEYVDSKVAAEIAALDLDGRLNEIYSLVGRLHGDLVTLLGQELRSLVFWPELYVGGIEATEYAGMRYTPMVTAGAATNLFTAPGGVQCEIDLTESPANQWNYVAGPARNERVYAPIETVQYHMNPASAVIDNVNDLSFESRDVEYVTRSNDSRLGMTVEGMELRQGSGVLKVEYKLNPTAILRYNYDNADDQVDGNNKKEASVFALSVKVRDTNTAYAQYGDTTITSDYAMMYVSEVDPQAIAYENNSHLINRASACPTTANPDELWPTVKEAIEHAPTLPVAWNGQIDLKEHLQSHYNWASETSNRGTHKVWAYGEEAKYGLHYDYALVQYKAGVNVTSDSKYVEQDVTSGIIRPANVDAQGNTVSGQQNVASVGRHPLVRVRLLDEEGNVVLVGFIKLEITRDVPFWQAGPFAKHANFGCNSAVVDATWAEISAEILSKLNISKTDFELLYEFDAAATGIGYQFAAAGSETPLTAANTIYGQVREVQDVVAGTTTSVLRWTLTMSDMQRIYQENNDHSKSIWVRYKSRNNDSEHAPVYVQLKVTVHKPAGVIDTKIEQYWYSDGSTRLNVKYPRDGENTRDFVVDLNQVWEVVNGGVNMPVFNPGPDPLDGWNPSSAGGFTSYTDAIFANQGANLPTGGYKYYFDAQNDGYELPNSGGYKLYVNNTTATDILGRTYPVNYDNTLKYALQANTGVYTNTTLYAGRNRASAVAIAEINQATGEITYLRNTTSQYLLNLYGHNDAQLIAHIGVVPYTPCGIAMATDGNEYPDRILRPIDVVEKTHGNFRDAEANGSLLNIADLLDFNDWRGEKFVNGNNYSNCWLFAYYNVSGVKVRTDRITTNMNGHNINTDLLSSVTRNVSITQVEYDGVTPAPSGVTFSLNAYNSAAQGTAATYDDIKEFLGKIKYENNGNNVQDFDVRIPIEITYDWSNLSPLTVYVTCHVEGTMGNN